MTCACEHETDAAALAMGWQQRAVEQMGGRKFEGRKYDMCFWCDSEGTPIIDVWTFRAWPRLADELQRALDAVPVALNAATLCGDPLTATVEAVRVTDDMVRWTGDTEGGTDE